MPIELKKKVAVCTDACTIEEAETLLQWLLETPKGKINLKLCVHLHTAIFQVLIAAKPTLSALPLCDDLNGQLFAAGLVEEFDL